MARRGKKIFITGIGGYLGSTILSELPAEYSVVGYGRGSNFGAVLKIARKRKIALSLVKGDITDERAIARAVRGADAVVHAAGVVGNGACLADPWTAIRTNIRGTRSLVGAIRRSAKGTKPTFIHISTQSVYGTFRELPMPIRETAKTKPDDLYGATKAEAEWEALQIPVTILRLTNLFGLGAGIGHEKNIVSRFANMAAVGEPLTVFGDGSQGIDFVHVRDAASAALDALEEMSKKTAIYNVGSGAATPMKEVAETMSRAAKHLGGPEVRVLFKEAPPGKLWPSRWVSANRIAKAVGWKPRVALEAGIEELLNYYYENNPRS